MPVEVRRLGPVEYGDGLQAQEALSAAIRARVSPPALLLLQHPPVLTLGRRASREHLLVSEAHLAQAGIELHASDRGGDVTYHGPGQVVGYPILDLRPNDRDVHRYVRRLEEVMLRTLADYGVEGRRHEGLTGAWVGDEKVGAIGVRIDRWITRHGFAFNVDPDLDHFGLIVPCGIRTKGVTSLARLLGRRPPVREVEDRLLANFAGVFTVDTALAEPSLQEIQVVVTRGGAGGASPEVLLLRRLAARGGCWRTVTGKRLQDEGAPKAAARELREKIGLDAPVRPLGYVHSFVPGPATNGDSPVAAPRHAQDAKPTRPPVFVQETCFAAAAPAGFEPTRLSLDKHDSFGWFPLGEALSAAVLQPGTRRAIRLAAGLEKPSERWA